MHVQIDWSHLGREQFERVVETLLARMYRDDPDLRAEPVDGRGGDEGRDVDVVRRADDELEGIYQLKYFPDGLSGERVKRREQVRRSFVAAMQHDVRFWTLVIPVNPTPKEKAFVRKLRGERDVKVKIMGRADLDVAIAQYPDLIDYYNRDGVLAILRDIGQEKAGLATTGDLDDTLSNLRRRIDGRSPDWGEVVRLERGTTIRELYAKDPRAPELEPITINLVTDLDKLDAETRDRLTAVLDYGLGSVSLPPLAVQSFKIEGPEWIASEEAGVHIEFHTVMPDGKAGRPFELRILNDQGWTDLALRGHSTRTGQGAVGVGVVAEFPGGLTMTFQFPRDRSESGSLQITFEVAGQDAVAAERALRVSETIRSGRPAQVWVDDLRLATVVASVLSGAADQDPAPLLLASDLAVISRYFDIPLVIPGQLSGHERAEIRSCRLLLEGRCVLVPGVRGMTAQLSGSTDERFEEILSGGEHLIAVDSGLLYEVQGHQLAIPEARVFHPRLRVEDGEQAVAALRAGNAQGTEVSWVPVDGHPFRAYLPDAQDDPNEPLVPVPLDVPGLDEHPAIAELNRSRRDTAESGSPPSGG